jgi:hypothetical protein
MAITGHKTLRVFQRDNLIDEGDLQEAMASLQTYLTDHDMHVSMDTSAASPVTASAVRSGGSRG